MVSKEERRMLQDIGIVDFTLTELILFLDTHPGNREAMEYFNYYSGIKNKMMKDFSMMYYPLRTDYADSAEEWKWGAALLPWEGGY